MTTPATALDDGANIATVHRHTVHTISDQLIRIADELATDLINSGCDPQTAGSVIANTMLRAAWAVAGSGKIMAGVVSLMSRFLASAREMAATIKFTHPASEAQNDPS